MCSSPTGECWGDKHTVLTGHQLMQLIGQLIGRGDKHWLLGGTNSLWGLNILGGQTYCSGGGDKHTLLAGHQ